MAELKFTNYGQLRELNCTEDELVMYDILRSVTGADDLEFMRRSDSYVTAAIGDTDVARFKFTARAKWILFPYESNEKIRIGTPEDVREHSEEARNAVETARKING